MHALANDLTKSPVTDASTTELIVGGMTCGNCARRVGEALQGVTGVTGADVRLDEGRATVHWSPGTQPGVEQILAAVREAGYEATPVEERTSQSEQSSSSPMAAWRFTVIFGAVLTVPLILGEWVFGLGMQEWFHWIGLAFSTPVMIVCGGRFYRGAWQQLKHGRSNMDTLVALGSTTAFSFSLWGLLTGPHGHLYFMEAAAIITLVSAGHYMEALVSARAASSLRALMNLAPQTARKRDDRGIETEVPVASLKVSDTIVLKPGDRVPTDGEVVEGASAVDESMLTGESVPIDKATGAKLYAGTVSQNGRLVMCVTATGDATALAAIIAVVQRAQSSRANIQKLGDQVSSVFVPIVVVIALATGLWWGLAYEQALALGRNLTPYLWPAHFPATALAAAFIHAAGVLIVACPCAMGLATPAAIMVGTNVAARRGILIRDGAALEKSGRITAVLFDKTGTLTQGKLTVAAVEDLRPASMRADRVEKIASVLAKPSNHPVSLAVAAVNDHRDSNAIKSVAGFGGHRPPLQNWQELRGKGVQANLTTASPDPSRLGSLNWLRESGVDLQPAAQFVNEWSGQGATILGLAEGSRLIGLLALRDTIKPDTNDVIRRLQRQGKAAYLITGDNTLTAVAVAQQAGIPKENVFAEIRPEQKAGIVMRLQQRGERVAFVGDGINDAPALEQADLGIAVSKASDVAREAADIILLKSDIQAIPEALGLAQATLRTIRQNLFWAFFYNAAAIPLAALGFLSPVICALAMGLSDLIVIGNALRLRRWKD